MIYLVLLGITFVVQLFTVFWYILYEGVKGKMSAIGFKAVCSALFVVDAFLSGAMIGSFSSRYFVLVTAGLISYFIGDIFLNLTQNAAFKAGMAFFLIGHAFYSCAFSVELSNMFGVSFFNIVDIVIWLVLLIGFAALSFKKGLFDFKGMRAPVIAYCAVILIMAIKAVHFGINCQISGEYNLQTLSFTLIIGALGFVVSDIILLFMYFDNKNTRKNALLNAYSYYFAQMILACSIFFIGG